MKAYLANRYCGSRGVSYDCQVCHSANGWYIGVTDHGEPISRESEEYYRTRKEAEIALRDHTFTQRENP